MRRRSSTAGATPLADARLFGRVTLAAMPYAQGRTFFDADSHVMELPDFLRDHADPGDREKLPELSFASGGKMRVALDELKSRQGHAPEHVEELIELGDGLIAGPKGYEALGAFNPAERSQA